MSRRDDAEDEKARFADAEDEMARFADARRREAAQDQLDALDLDFYAFASCPSGPEYVHKPGVFCPACGGVG